MLPVVIAWLLRAAMGYLKGLADTEQHDPEYRNNGWKAKWRLDGYLGRPVLNTPKTRPWWYRFGYSSRYVERFPLSSTLLVAFTDKWHFYNFLSNRILECAIAYYCEKWWLVLVLWVPAGVFFALSYRKKSVSKSC